MIVKKVVAKKTAVAKSKALHVRDLCDYIAGPNAGDRDEKVEHRGAVNLLNLDHDAQVLEMADLAEAAKRAPQPVQHWILSWRQGEQPTADQADQAVRLFLDEMGLGENQAIYALHRNTDNCHLHLAVNRIHPETERVITVNRGFDIEVAHRAIARIEHEQGWQRERGGRYQVRDEQLVRADQGVPVQREPTTAARDFENLTGQKSAQRTVIEEGADLMRRARSWRELHELLAERGMRFERKSSGALLWVGETAVKPSTAGRDCSMSALEKRLGDFKPQIEHPLVRPRMPEPVAPASPRWGEYISGRQDHYAAKKLEHERLGQRQRDERGRVARAHRQERHQILGGDWRGKGMVLNALRSVLAARQAKEKAAMRDRQQLERATCRERFPSWPLFEEWTRHHSPELAERWRFRDRKQAGIMGDRDDPARPRDIRAFEAEARGWEVLYSRIGARGGPAFVDRGRQILIHDLTRDSVLGALQLSAQKWGTFTVFGSDDYKRQCVALAAEHGLRIANPELQQAIAGEKERRQDHHRRLAGHTRQPPVRARDRPRAPEVTAERRKPVRDVGEAYARHFEELCRQRGRADLSRVDAVVAVRLRVTGYGRKQVDRAIREGAPKLRPNEARDWDEYAKRTVDHAFGVSGERGLSRMEKDRDRLLTLEGRAQVREEMDRDMRPFPGLGRGR